MSPHKKDHVTTWKNLEDMIIIISSGKFPSSQVNSSSQIQRQKVGWWLPGIGWGGMAVTIYWVWNFTLRR